MMEIKKIIWASDGSQESDEALHYARFLAQRFDSEIVGTYVIGMHQKLLYDYSRDPDSEVYRWVEHVAENHKARLASIADELSTKGLSFRGEVLIGEPSEEIVRFARDEKADLIVMGKRGHGLIDRILVGSTTLKVLRESSVPVLAVGKKDKEGAIDIRNILVPIEIYEKVDSALNYAIGLAQKINANILVLYVLYMYDYETYYRVAEDLTKHSSDELAKRVEEIKRKLGIRNKEVTPIEISTGVIQGISCPVAIVDYASIKGFDLIVMNTHRRKGIKKFILGSVTEKVIQESHCAALALRP